MREEFAEVRKIFLKNILACGSELWVDVPVLGPISWDLDLMGPEKDQLHL